MFIFKKRFFSITCLILILSLIFCLPKHLLATSIEVSGTIYDRTNTKVENITGFLFDWDLVQQYGLLPQCIVYITKSSSLASTRGNLEPALKFELGKEYLLIFTTRHFANSSKNYPDFFYGKVGANNWVSDPNKNYLTAPRIILTDSGFQRFPAIYIPQEGFYLLGLVTDEQNNSIEGARIELYKNIASNVGPFEYPFYRFVETTTTKPNNFAIKGLSAGVKYYVKVIGSELNTSYEDAFFYETNSKVPKAFEFAYGESPQYKDIGQIKLKRACSISGYLKDSDGSNIQLDQNDLIDSLLAIHVLEDNPTSTNTFYNFFANCFDPDKSFSALYPYAFYETDQEFAGLYYGKYFQKNRFNYNPNGFFSIKGIPSGDHEYIIFFQEFPTDIFAYPQFYADNNTIFDYSLAERISFPSPGGTKNVNNVRLQRGLCISGNINFSKVLSLDAARIIEDQLNDSNIIQIYADQNVVIKKEITLAAYRYNYELSLERIRVGDTVSRASFNLCGLAPGEYQLIPYDQSGIYVGESSFNTIEIDLSGGGVSNIEVKMDLGAKVKGKLLDKMTGKVPSNLGILLYPVNEQNPIRGYYYNNDGSIYSPMTTKVDSNTGQFYAWGLSKGYYLIYSQGYLVKDNIANSYLPQFYNSQGQNILSPNGALPVMLDINQLGFIDTNTIYVNKPGIESGRVITGTVNTSEVSLSGYSIEYCDNDSKIWTPVPNHLIKSDPNDSSKYALMMLMDGNYILRALDNENIYVPHYYLDSSQSTTNPYMAKVVSIGKDENPGEINFYLNRKSGSISGRLLNKMGKGLSGLTINAKQLISEGKGKGTWEVTKSSVTDINGDFRLKWLSETTYKIHILSPANSSLYATQYYNSDPNQYAYDIDLASEVIISQSNLNRNILFYVQEGGSLKGTVSGAQSAKVYAFFMRNNQPIKTFETLANPNYSFIGLLPGSYVLGYVDSNFRCMPKYYNNVVDPEDAQIIEIGAGERIYQEITFGQSLGTTIEGFISKNNGGNIEYISDALVYVYPVSAQGLLYLSDYYLIFLNTFSDQQGHYSINGLASGDYWIATFVEEYGPLFIQCSIEENYTEPSKHLDITYPSDWHRKKYTYTLSLKKGLNLIAYPTLYQLNSQYTSNKLLLDVARMTGAFEMRLGSYSHNVDSFRRSYYGSISFQDSWLTMFKDDVFNLYGGDGLIFYSKRDLDIFFQFYPGQTALQLFSGKNFVGNIVHDPNMTIFTDPNIFNDPYFTTREMLKHLGESTVSIKTLDAEAGKWNTNYWMWGKSNGPEVRVEDSRGYVIEMKEEKRYWYPKK